MSLLGQSSVNHNFTHADATSRAREPERVYLSVPHMSGLEQAYVSDAFATNWLSSVGPNLDGFESEMAARLGHDVRTLAVASGTAALHLVLRALDVGPGDRVAVSTLTFAGSVWPILYLGATPVFLDSESRSGNLDPALVEDYLARAARDGTLPKALVVVHLYGQHADVDPIADACRRHGVALVEDAAESLGATYRGRQTGTTAEYAILSFNGNKIITTTGGGMVVTRDAVAMARMRKWANQSREPAVEYVHREVGYNYRMSNVLAGIGRGQLRVLDQRVQRRREVHQIYRNAFADVAELQWMPEPQGMRSTRWLTCLVLQGEGAVQRRDHVLRSLERHSIEARPVWKPMHLQPLFEGAPYFAHAEGDDVAARLFEAGVCLPSGSNLSDEQLDRVVDHLRRALQRAEVLGAAAV